MGDQTEKKSGTGKFWYLGLLPVWMLYHSSCGFLSINATPNIPQKRLRDPLKRPKSFKIKYAIFGYLDNQDTI